MVNKDSEKKVNDMSKRKNIMATWKEFNPISERSMKDDFKNTPSPFREKIIEYLNNGEFFLVEYIGILCTGIKLANS